MKKVFTFIACAIAFVPGLWSDEDLKTELQILQEIEIIPEIPVIEISQEAPLNIEVYQRKEVIPLLPLLDSWCTQSFGPFPYLYAPREDQVVNIADFVYLNEKNSLIIVVKKGEQVVAVAGGAALDSFYLTHYYFTPDLIETMQNKGYDPSNYFYVGYFLVAPEFRSDLSVIEPIYDALAFFCRSIGKSQLTYIDMLHADNHPLKPEVFSSPEPWGTAITGFTAMDLFTEQEWPTFQPDGSIADQKHILQFYRKSID